MTKESLFHLALLYSRPTEEYPLRAFRRKEGVHLGRSDEYPRSAAEEDSSGADSADDIDPWLCDDPCSV